MAEMEMDYKPMKKSKIPKNKFGDQHEYMDLDPESKEEDLKLYKWNKYKEINQ